MAGKTRSVARIASVISPGKVAAGIAAAIMCAAGEMGSSSAVGMPPARCVAAAAG